MRQLWVKVDPWNKELVTSALEGGADAVWVPDGCSDKVKALGKITTICAEGDLQPERDVVRCTVEGRQDEDRVLELGRKALVVVECPDWTVIPLENLVARGAAVVAKVSGLEEARTAAGILEKGVERILLEMDDPVGLKHALAVLRETGGRVELVQASVVAVSALGMGDRVCVDTCTCMSPGQGMLVGNSSQALFLIHAESLENPYVAARPFRVNAGPVHAYTRVGAGRTRYLSELKAGDTVLIVDHEGKANQAVVGRLKIERRPLLLVEAEIEGRRVATIVQNAETIRFTAPDGQAVSVVELEPGSQVLVALEAGARHFGHAIEESITEK